MKATISGATVTTELARFYLCDALLRLANTIFDAAPNEPAAQEQAKAHLNRAVALGSQNADVFLLLGRVHQAAGRETDAFDRAAALQTGALQDAKKAALDAGASTAQVIR